MIRREEYRNVVRDYRPLWLTEGIWKANQAAADDGRPEPFSGTPILGGDNAAGTWSEKYPTGATVEGNPSTVVLLYEDGR